MRQQSKTTERPRLRPAPQKEQPLLYDRKRAAELLGGCSQAMLIAMEHAGTLQPIKLNRSENGKTFYRASQIHKLAEKGVTPAEEDGEQ
jgi:hypothetical protein